MDRARFEDLLRLWQDGEASPEELRELDELLRRDPSLGRELVTSVLLEVNLYRRYAVQGAAAKAPSRRRVWEAAAAVLVLAVSAFLVGRVLWMKEDSTAAAPSVAPVKPATPPAPRRRTPAPTPSVATLVRLLDQSPFSLGQALERASRLDAGVPVNAEIEEEKGSVRLSVTMAAGTRLREIEFDAKTLEVIDEEDEDEDLSGLATALKVPLKTAMEKALEVVPGRVAEVEAEAKGGRVWIEVKVLIDNELREVRIDGVSGEILRK
jgi:uncharacterized membrane protein YkoI